MLSPDQIESLRVAFEQLADPINDYLIKDIARRISEAGRITSTASYQMWRARTLGTTQQRLERELTKLLGTTQHETRDLLEQAAAECYGSDLKRLAPSGAVPFASNTIMQQITAAAVVLAQDDLSNIVQSTAMGFTLMSGETVPISQAYFRACDFAFLQVSTGAADYNTATREATDKLASDGVKTIDYITGVHTSLEAAVRRNIMGGLGLMQEQIEQQLHDDLGCNGWEISAHANSAPDHEPIQGRQYSDEAYQSLNDSLVRRIGTLNCGHVAAPIIPGVNTPQYTPAELQKFREDNEKGVDFEGRHYTGYEATQRQRALERSMRSNKRRMVAAREQGREDDLARLKSRQNVLLQRYNEFSAAAGLRTQEERMFVSRVTKK